METTKPRKVHIGRNIARIRELKGIKQELLAAEMRVTQQTISKIEQSETLDDKKLKGVADALGVTPEAIKNFNEEAVIYNVQNNYEGSNSGAENVSVTNYQCNFNPIEKIVDLYERLLASEREKVEILKGGSRKS